LLAHQSASGYLPQPAIYSKAGKPLLSWRVAVLPYLDQKTLYQRFKLDEPWDSAHNRELLQHMPKVFESPGAPTARPHSTYYQVFVGPGAMFESDPQRHLRTLDITDDRATTLLLVEAGEAVEWTRPADLAFEAGKPLPRLGGPTADGFHACFCNNAVLFLKKEINDNEKLLRALIGRQDGELVNLRPYEQNATRAPPVPLKNATMEQKTGQEQPRDVQDKLATARELSRKNFSKNNLRLLGMALRAYNARIGCLPAPAICTPDGTPLLS
jgi:hypothetical protein